MGRLGCLVAMNGESVAIHDYPVSAVDTTAAGDTFNGALAVAPARGEGLVDGARFANAAAALSVTKPGAIQSIPTGGMVAEFRAQFQGGPVVA